MKKGAKAKILVVEDERSMREVLTVLLDEEGYDVVSACDGTEGIKHIDNDIYDVIITDIKMPGVDGFEVLKRATTVSPDTAVVIITAFGTTESAIEAMKLGALDYVQKPFKVDEIRLIVKNAIDRRRLKAEVAALRERVRDRSGIDNIIGKSPQMMEILRILPRVAANNSNVLITGESGTGKEVIAEALHSLSPRSEKSMVAINCASFPEGLLESELFGHMRGAFTGAVQNKQGLFELADKGTLLLDELAEMPVTLQSKLLRAIETGSFRRVGGTQDITVDVRIIAATNRDPQKAMKDSALREDLYYRLSTIPIHLPPLRERKEDIPLFIEHFINKYTTNGRRFTPGALKLLTECPWRGNVRELENVLERILLFTDSEEITENDLPEEVRTPAAGPLPGSPDVSGGVALDDIIEKIEKSYLTEALKKTGGNKTEASKLLALSFRSFRHRLQKYGIK